MQAMLYGLEVEQVIRRGGLSHNLTRNSSILPYNSFFPDLQIPILEPAFIASFSLLLFHFPNNRKEIRRIEGSG